MSAPGDATVNLAPPGTDPSLNSRRRGPRRQSGGAALPPLPRDTHSPGGARPCREGQRRHPGWTQQVLDIGRARPTSHERPDVARPTALLQPTW